MSVKHIKATTKQKAPLTNVWVNQDLKSISVAFIYVV
jgi:hypothetical protein